MIDAKMTRELKTKAHHLKPIVLLGDKGLTDNVIKEIIGALEYHELIKVKIASSDRENRKLIGTEITKQCECDLIQIIGNIAILYKKKVQKAKTKGRK